MLEHKTITLFASSNTSAGAIDKSSNGADFSLNYNPAIAIPSEAKNCFVEIPSASIWNTTLNISADLANNTFTFTNDAGLPTKYSITIPDGRYSVALLSAAIERLATAAVASATGVFSLSGDTATSRVVLNITEAGWQVNFPASGSIRSLLGFDAQLIPSGGLTTVAVSQSGDSVANFGNLSAFLIQTSLTQGSSVFLNGKKSSAAHIAQISAAPGSLINSEPYNPLRIQSNQLSGANLDRIDFRLTDQDGVTVDTNSEDWSCRIVIEYDIEK